VYTSATASLAALEYLVNLEPEDAPADLVLVPADVPASLAVKEVRAETLAAEWRSVPAPQSLARLGMEWARAQTTAVLSLPSAVLPFERDYLLSPGHRDFVSIVVGRPLPFTLDPRLWKTRPSQA